VPEDVGVQPLGLQRRAVLCRGGQALALSEDHKPQSETERNRITAAGGFVADVGGVSRCCWIKNPSPVTHWSELLS